MAKPKSCVVGYCSIDSFKILIADALPEDAREMKARLVFCAEGEETRSKDVTLHKQIPYGVGWTEIRGLTAGSSIEYAVDTATSTQELKSVEEIENSGFDHHFRLLPDDRPLKIGLISCNRFTDEEDPEERFAMWKRLKQEIEAGNVDILFHVGDQVYADHIREELIRTGEYDNLSSSDSDTVEKTTQKYRECYVDEYWSKEPVRTVLASCPNVMMWDDHDIYDGFGSRDRDSQEQAQAVFRAAKYAFIQFQSPLNPETIGEDSFAFSFVHKPSSASAIGYLVLDARMHRKYKDGVVLGNEQFDRIDERLKQMRDEGVEHLFVVMGIPPVHVKAFKLQKWVSVLGSVFGALEQTDDLRDSWLSEKNKAELERLLLRLFEFMQADSGKNRQVTILAGDVHVATLGKIESSLHRSQDGKRKRIYQIVSSGIGSKPPSGIEKTIMDWFVGGFSEIELCNSDITGDLIKLAEFGNKDFIDRRNFAIIKLASKHDETKLDEHGNIHVEFYAEGEKKPILDRLLGV